MTGFFSTKNCRFIIDIICLWILNELLKFSLLFSAFIRLMINWFLRLNHSFKVYTWGDIYYFDLILKLTKSNSLKNDLINNSLNARNLNYYKYKHFNRYDAENF